MIGAILARYYQNNIVFGSSLILGAGLIGYSAFFENGNKVKFNFWSKDETFGKFRKIKMSEGEKLNEMHHLSLEDYERWRDDVTGGIRKFLGDFIAREFSDLVDIETVRLYPTMEESRHKGMEKMLLFLKTIDEESVRFNSEVINAGKKI